MTSVETLHTDEKLSATYQKKTDREHILDTPDTYIGSIETDAINSWIFDKEGAKIIQEEFKWTPGLYKCFDEGIVNARDHVIRMSEKKRKGEKVKLVTNISITVNKETGVITMMNDGNGIDVALHPEHKLYIPEMIFGHLRTSTNYKKDEKKIVGGKNGFGFKLVLIYAKWGTIETIDHTRGLKYVQTFRDNLSVIDKPKITKNKSKPYIKVTWLPDYERFGMKDGLTDDMFRLFRKRTFDISAVTEKSVKVKFNGSLIPVKTFEQYVDMYVGKKSETKRIYEKANERWEYAVCLSPNDEFTQVSFVNGIYTSRGGKHVDYILNQITRKVIAYIEKKKKIKVKPTTIKEQLMLFVNCVVENPAFDSQTKDTLNTKITKFGSSCKISDKFVDKVIKLGIMEQAISINQVRQTKNAKKSDGKKTRSVRGIPKLIDANFAGTVQSSQCTLILCEGDSAKAGIVSGLSREDRNTIGVYPLRGKLMNVRDAAIKRITSNAEIADIKKILGLETNKKYETRDIISKSLRYGKVLFMTDQDLDGIHIKGLCINLFDSQWNDLIKVDSFLGFMNTPILKAKKGNTELCFYNDKEYEDWKRLNDTKGWKIKYYKGLGTSTSKEFKEYFSKKKIVEFKSEVKCSEELDKVFRKTRADDRKTWLEHYDKDDTLDTNVPTISFTDFINKEMIHYSKYDNERSIPNIMDGLKTSLRKILYCAFKRNLIKEIKVAQFGGYVSEHSGYHHGEASLMQAIVGMAQEYLGSNNINILMPNGQFGTRLQGGSDSASERYIFTQLNNITKFIYKQEDNGVLNYLDDDGTLVEPDFYVPIIPMILVNGSTGIGTGFSTDIMCYNPQQIIKYIKHTLTSVSESVESATLSPYYEGFKGTITKVEDDKYMFKGVYEVIKKNTIHITELPIGTWTENYKAFLEKQMDASNDKKRKVKPIIKDYKDMSTDTNIDITVTFNAGWLDKLMKKKGKYDCSLLEDKLNLTTTKKTSNMHMFDEKQQLKKFNSPEEIINYYIPIRLRHYKMRKKYQIAVLEKEARILSNKARFIEEQCNDTIDLRRKKRDVVVALLKARKYDTLDNDKEYKYLRSMPIDSMIEENIKKLRKEMKHKLKELEIVRKTSIQRMWLNELNMLEAEYVTYIRQREARQKGVAIKKVKSKRKKRRTKIKLVLKK